MKCNRPSYRIILKAFCVSLLSSNTTAWNIPVLSLKTSTRISVPSPTTPLHPILSLPNAESIIININKNNNMLVRIRSNVGTWRLDLPDDDNQMKLTSLQSHDKFAKYRFTLPLSLDPAGKQVVNAKQPLQKQGIRNGTMLYCRLEEKNGDENKDEPKPSMSSAVKPNPPEQEVIDLLDSDDEDEVQIVGTKSGKESMTASSQPRKRQRSDDKKASLNQSSASKKRSTTSSAALGRSTSLKTQQADNNSNVSNFQVASYNVWFGPQQGMTDAGQVYPKERMTAIVNCLQKACMTRPDSPLLFVGLQELTPSLVGYIKPLLSQMGYKLCTQPLGASYGVGVAVPRDMNIIKHEFIPYTNSVQGRGLLYVRTPTMLLATTHLESYMSKEADGAAQREEQMKTAARFCQDLLDAPSSTLKFAAIMGDLNWDDERVNRNAQGPNRPLLSLLPRGWKDAGVRLDYTYDTRENPMFKGGIRRRFDRCVYFSKRDAVKCDELQKIGKACLPGLFWNKLNPYNNTTKRTPVAPSDHFGIVMSFGRDC